MATLLLENLVKIYNKKLAVDNVTMEVKSGRVTGLLGPNGAGKTTTFYMAVGMIRADKGRVLLDDENLTHDPMYIRAQKGLGYLPQESSVFVKLTVEENITAILEIRNMTAKIRKELAQNLMAELGISHLHNRRAFLLSGGERRRLEIARSLATEPSFMLLDEPFAGIDPLAVIEISKIIKQMTIRGIGVLISDHNVRETLGVCDNAYILNHGKVIESGSPDKIAKSEVARRFYLGEGFVL